LFDLIPPRRHDAPTFNGCSSATPEDRCTMPVLPSDPGATNGGAPKSRQAVRSSLRPGLYWLVPALSPGATLIAATLRTEQTAG